jgi:cytochrome b6-f complex iron-sulfur subunit
MNRREFVRWMTISSVASSLPVAIAACHSQPPASQAPSSPSSDGFQTAGTTAALDKEGQIFNKGLASGPVLVIRDRAKNNQVIAVNPTCPHAGCAVAWTADQNAFVCPCHASKFAADGSVLQGPAKTALATYSTKIAGDAVLVKVN